MKKILLLLLACITVLSLSACDFESLSSEDNKDNTQNEVQNTDTNENNEQPSELSWDELTLPKDFPRLSETVSSFRINDNGRYCFTWENTDLQTSQAKVDMMRSWANGTITGSTVAKNTTWQIQNDKINLTAAYSDESKLMMLETSVTEGSGLSSYLAAHTFTEEDFIPVGFREFGEITTSGEKFGGITQNGMFEIYIEDGSYKKEDAVAWCDTIIKRIAEISAANDNVITDLRNNSVTSYDEYAEKNGGTPECPNIGCYFASELDGKDYIVKIVAGYYDDTGVYRVQLSTMRRIY